jgi:hypothetical protein
LSLLSAGCLFWLERLQPLFVALAVLGLGYQSWLVWRRPFMRRTRRVMTVYLASLAVNVGVLSLWVWLWLRYR